MSSCAEALNLVSINREFNPVVTNAVGDMSAAQLAHGVRRARLDLLVVVLAYDYREVEGRIGFVLNLLGCCGDSARTL